MSLILKGADDIGSYTELIIVYINLYYVVTVLEYTQGDCCMIIECYDNYR